MIRTLCLISVFLISQFTNAQADRPKLIVGIVVDQMKTEYLYKFEKNFTDGGFKRLINQGYNCKATHFDYIPTYTGPGHASIYTGTTPAMHGVIANSFYDRFLKEKVYCAYDPTVHETEGDSEEGMMSARRILTTTIGDEMKMFNPDSKVIGISLKDRASTFPAGHAADAAYWLNGERFISSTAYLDKYPVWVNAFNDKRLVNKYISQDWTPLYDANKYVLADDQDYEGLFAGETKSVFPHKLKKIFKEEKKYGLIKETPFGNTITTDMAIEAVKNELLGDDDDMDLLAVSYSSTDYVGHEYGTQAMELEDTYYRLDADLKRLFDFLDQQVGVGQYTVFLTADHGAAITPGFLKDHKINAGFFDGKKVKKDLEEYLEEQLGGDNWVESFKDNYIFLNDKKIRKSDKTRVEIYRMVKNFLMKQEHIGSVYDRISIMENDYSDWLGSRVKKGFNPKYSADIIFLESPGVISNYYVKSGTTHGSGYTYDTHVPLLWMGAGIPHGETMEQFNITDIVSTLCLKFDIPLPSGAIGRAIPMD